MTTYARAYGAKAASEPLGPLTVVRRDLDERDVLIEIAYCGICHSDIHTVTGEWGDLNYPIIPGHEITGIVTAIGPAVTRHAVGDRVGVGCLVDSCGVCPACTTGHEQYCEGGLVGTYGGVDKYGEPTQGGYTTHIVVTEGFVLHIPDGLALDAAAPLLCAGITTYSPLRRFAAGPGKQVAVVGLGGLGHMGVKLAATMGAEVTVLSQTLDKAEDSRRMGASHHYAISDPATFDQLAGRFDLILNTVSAQISVDSYLKLLHWTGTLVALGLPPEPLPVLAANLVHRGRSFAGSMIGGIAQTQEMLDFCAEHGLGSDIEVIRADEINRAYERVLKSDVRYRFVIDTTTI